MKLYKRVETSTKTCYDTLGRPHHYTIRAYIRDCLICGREIKCRKGQVASKKLCSLKCSSIWFSKILKGRVKSKYHVEKLRVSQRKGTFKSCNNCNKRIYVTRWALKHNKLSFCNITCFSSYQNSHPTFSKVRSTHATKTKIKNSTIISGKNHWNWKGGVYPFKIVLYYSNSMKKWRYQVFKRDNFCCKICNSSKNLQAHHIIFLYKLLDKLYKKYSQTYVKNNFSKINALWTIKNGVTLCRSCHSNEHKKN